MNNPGRVSLETEKRFQGIIAILKKNRYTILGTLIAGFWAYTYMFTNKIPNHDDLHYLFGKGATIESGRWGLTILSYLFIDYSMPWIYGVLSLLIISAAMCLLVRIFSIHNTVLQFLLGAVIVSFPSQIGIFGYMFTAVSYAVSLWLGIAAAYIVCNCTKKMSIIALLLMVLSLSIYQAYIAITASIFIVYTIYMLITSEESTQSIFVKGCYFVVFLVVSLGIYWIITKVIWKLSGTTLGEYASNSLTFSVNTIAEGIGRAYEEFYYVIRFREHRLIPTKASHMAHLVCLMILGGELLLWTIKRKDIVRTVLLLFLLAILPLGLNLMHVFVRPGAVHTLVLYSYVILYVLIIVGIERGQHTNIKYSFLTKFHTLLLDCSVVGIAFILINNIYIANEAYLKMHLAYENMYSFTTSIVTHLQSTPGYTSDSKVALIGDYPEQDYYDFYFDNLYGLAGVGGVNPNNYSYPEFFNYYTGVSINWATQEECNAITLGDEFSLIPSYPDYGFVTVIDDIFVIKLPESTES